MHIVSKLIYVTQQAFTLPITSKNASFVHANNPNTVIKWNIKCSYFCIWWWSLKKHKTNNFQLLVYWKLWIKYYNVLNSQIQCKLPRACQTLKFVLDLMRVFRFEPLKGIGIDNRCFFKLQDALCMHYVFSLSHL